MKSKIKTEKEKRAKPGRPRIFATDLPVYDSMEICRGSTGIPIAAMALAKKEGCVFVRHGRIHLEPFLKWWFNRPEKDDEEREADNWGGRDKRATALLKEVKLEEAKERVIEFLSVDKFIRNLVGNMFFGELERIASEFPASLKGKSEVEIAEEVNKQKKQIAKGITSYMETWLAKKGKL